ncbi:MAG: hypothetical protein PUC29_03480 [Clostridia bacterium]|nr:hypothetical protein [Clostridia bacterium]
MELIMKKLLIFALALTMLLVSCKGKTNNADTTENGTTEPQATETVTEKAADFDFENALINGYCIVNIGGTAEIEWESDTLILSRPSVAEVNGKTVTAKAEGVTLIGCEGTDKAYILCVLPDGETQDPMAGTPTLLEVGQTAFVEGFGAADGYSSSNTEAVALEGTTVRAKAPGYAVVDVSNVSMPKFFSFLVFDRTTE